MSEGVNWELIAQALEFSNPYEMLHYWYIDQGKSLSQISDIIDFDQKVVLAGLVLYGVIQQRPLKNKSGQRPGIFTCRYCNRQFYGDVRNVCCFNDECIAAHKRAEKEDKHRSANKHNAKQRKKVLNGCIICGRDKGVNRYYCRDCLSGISAGRMFDE